MKATILTIILTFFMVTALGMKARGQTPDPQPQVGMAISSSDSEQAETSYKIKAEPLPEEDSLDQAKVLMKDGVNLVELGQAARGNKEISRAVEIISDHIKKRKDHLTDSELDLRAEIIRMREQVKSGPCNAMAELQRCIKREWVPPCCNGVSQRIQVLFRLHKNGKISDLRIIEAAACPSSNQAALNAVNKAAPFYPLPSTAPNSVLIQFTFDYNHFANEKSEAVRIISPRSLILLPSCN